MDDVKIYNFVILKGVVWGLVLILLVTFILVLITSFMNIMNYELLNKILPVISLLIIIFVGFYIARHIDSLGWLNGGLGGMIYMGIIIMTGSFNIEVTIGPIFLLLLAGLFLGGLGGVVGINS